MALEAGGYSEKFGNRYEARWVAYQLLQLIDEKISSVTVEPIGNDEVGVDVVVENLNGSKEFHQCKASNANSESWTVSKLKQAGILTNAWYQIKRGMNEFHLVSPLPSKMLSDLSGSALNSNGDASDFYKFQVETSQPRKKVIDDLCSHLDIDSSKKEGLNDILLFLQRFKVILYVIDNHSANELEDKATALFSGEPNKLLLFLKNYPVEFNRLRTKITPSLLLSDLKNSGFQQRIQPDDNRISPVIERLSNGFSESMEPFLISKSLIKRPEVKDVINALDEHAVILIKSEAGMGKSSLLFDLHKQIQSNGAISVPIRLDRNRPDNNADSFGCKLGFPYSPVYKFKQVRY